MSTIPAKLIPEITDDDIRMAERYLGVAFDMARREILLTNENFDVQACPGSGKTTLLVAKLAILAEKWPHAYRGICVLSHTNVARREIETKLAGTSAGQRLLTYPHFVGTIHSFVNEFLALPLLRSEGKTIRLIDDEACGDCCHRLLHGVRAYATAKQFLAQKEQHSPGKTIRALRYEGADLCLASADGKLPCGPPSASFSILSQIKQRASASGLWRFDDMFAWAERLLKQHPEAAEFARRRFPAVFIDEMQDTQEIQGRLLAAVFPASLCGLRQRFGDSNQAIYDSGHRGASTESFPSGDVRSIPNSLRFGAGIAAKAEPLAPDPPRPPLVGEGPRRNLFPVAVDPAAMPHSVFLFGAGTATQVLPAFGTLLLDTFPDQVVRSEAFRARAIGRVGKPKEGDVNPPSHLGDYWTGYEPGAAKLEPRPRTLADYIHLAQRQRANVVDCAESMRTASKGIVVLLETIAPGASPGGVHATRWLWESVRNDESAARRLTICMWHWCVEMVPIAELAWHDQVEELRYCIRPIVGDQWNGEAKTFCQWSAEFAGKLDPTGPEVGTKPNRLRFTQGNRFVDIDVGTIHSAKGQTHTATLVVETFFKIHDMEDLLPWLLGAKSGAIKKEGVERPDRLRLVYTAMTRPTHLLCLAMRQEAFGQNGKLAVGIERLEARGWRVLTL